MTNPKISAQEGVGHASAAGNAGHQLPGAAVATPSAPAQYLAAAAADECRRILAEKDRLLTAARDERDAAREAKDGAYRERDRCVALVARMAAVLHWPTWLGRHVGAEWDDDWRNIVFVELPSGQVSWHIHDSELPLVAFLPHRDEPWDGHDTAEKYRRCEAPWPNAGVYRSPAPVPPGETYPDPEGMEPSRPFVRAAPAAHPETTPKGHHE